MRYRRMNIDGGTYFFTVVTYERRPLFSDGQAVALLNEVIARVQSRHPFDLEAQVVLPDHLHAIWQLPKEDANFSTRWRLIKEAFTREYVKRFERIRRPSGTDPKYRYAVWQHRFWEHVIGDDRDMAAHLDYIHLNPVHHGLAKSPSEWPHSTFTKYVARGVYEPTWGSTEKPELPAWAKQHE